MNGPSSILDAVNWVHWLLTGTLAVSIAILAVAVCGVAMMLGRLDWRIGLRTAIGCALIFGSAQIAGALMEGSISGEQAVDVAIPFASTAPPSESTPAVTAATDEGSDLESVYSAVRQAVSIRFPAASGVIHLRAAIGSNGEVRNLDISSDSLKSDVTELAARIISASGMRVTTGSGIVTLPDLIIGQDQDKPS